MGDKQQKEREKMTAERGFINLKKQFIFYASYHNQPVNVLIHLFCIWNLMWSGMCLLHSTPAVAPPPAALASVPLLGGTPLNLQLLVTLVYATTYVIMDPVAGSLFRLVHQVIMDPVA